MMREYYLLAEMLAFLALFLITTGMDGLGDTQHHSRRDGPWLEMMSEAGEEVEAVQTASVQGGLGT